jgi:hypothetical protein
MPTVSPKPVKTSDDPKQMLRFDLDNENETVRNYRERVRQCEALGEFAMAEQIRQILVQEHWRIAANRSMAARRRHPPPYPGVNSLFLKMTSFLMTFDLIMAANTVNPFEPQGVIDVISLLWSTSNFWHSLICTLSYQGTFCGL